MIGMKAPHCGIESDAQEGTKSLAFWFAIGGEQNYTHKEMAQETVKDQHLFTSSFNKRRFRVERIYSFNGHDLLTQDVVAHDTSVEVFISQSCPQRTTECF